MRKLLAGLLAVVFFSIVVPAVSRADVLRGPSGPPPPPKTAWAILSRSLVEATVVSVALTGSMVAVRRIRKKVLGSSSLEDAGDETPGPEHDEQATGATNPGNISA